MFPQRTPFKLRPSSRNLAQNQAFSLVELLVVMAIAAVLMGVVPPATKALLSGQGVEKGVNSTVDVLSYARSQALTRRTRVWVPLKNSVNAEGHSELRMAVIISKSGLNDWSLTNLKAVANPVVLPGVQAVKYSEMPAYVRNAPTNDGITKNDGNYVPGWIPSGFPDVVAGGQSFKNAPFISFDAEGHVATSASSDPYNLMFQSQACVGLAPTRGTTIQANATDGAILTIYGGSSKIRVTRP